LPVAAEHLPKAVDVQDADENSVLNAYREFLAWRKTQPALLHGDIEFLDAPENVLLFVRRYQDQTILAAFNLAADAITVNLPEALQVSALQKNNLPLAALNNQQLVLSAYASAFCSVA
jgi:alpha-glucosidase